MAQSLAQNAIALLIDLAEQGEIDPWDVQVIDVIDRFLSNLVISPQQGMGRTAYETSLSESGQAILYASMLVLLKADSLARSPEPVEPEAIDEDDLMEVGEILAALPPALERTLQRRAVARPPQQRRVTLQELIDQLKLIEAAIEHQPSRTRARRARPHSRSQAVRTIAQLAHQENLLEIVAAIEQFLEHYCTTADNSVNQSINWVDFDTLLLGWSEWQQKTESLHHLQSDDMHTSPEQASIADRVSVFWALLFLSAQSKVELLQEEFYQELKVRSLANEHTQDKPQAASE